MKEKINVGDYAKQITEGLSKGILLNTNTEKFNSMVIGWGALGRVWNLPAFTVYVREHRYTKGALDKTGEFTISVPMGDPDLEISRICGSLSGFNIDKVKEAGLTLEDPEVIKTPGIREYPLTLECRILYAQEQELPKIPEELRTRFYPQDIDGSDPMANRDAHTMYIGQIVAAYMIK
ncbi:MAG: flavin reductase [Lachnospiraceae bacterium]|nr:flavin reductase [Lachnospiraceae bacterium]